MTPDGASAQCVVNISEGRDPEIVGRIAAAGGDQVLDVHSDPTHHRSVLTLAGPLDEVESSARQVASVAASLIDLRTHRGVHPRLGAVDVVPFVPLTASWDAVLQARGAYAGWSAATLGVPCFLYGPERSLPDVRRQAFTTLAPDTGPATPHPTAGATAVGARSVLIAYNVWITGTADAPGVDPVAVARTLAARVRRPGLRTLGLAVDGGAQVSCNVVDPARVTLVDVYDEVVRGVAHSGCTVTRGELVGLLPEAALTAVPEPRRAELGVRAEDTIEFRLDTRRS